MPAGRKEFTLSVYSKKFSHLSEGLPIKQRRPATAHKKPTDNTKLNSNVGKS
jgi:hypothetical protein